MKRTTLLLLFCLGVQALYAQKFFKSMELLPFVYFDDAYYSKKDIKEMYKVPGAPLSGNRLDSLNAVLEKHGYVNGGKGIQLRLQKILPFFKEASRRQIEWNVGGGFRTYQFRSLSYTGYYTLDSTIDNLREQEQFRLQQNYTDLYSAVVYKIHGRSTPGLMVSLGFGIQGSFVAGRSRMVENYRSVKVFWNGSTWEQKEKKDTTLNVAAIRKADFRWMIPLGIRFKISEKLSAGSSFEYFHRRKYPRNQKTYSEGLFFMLAIRYNL